MINIEILDDTIDPAGLQRQVATQIDDIKSMIARVSDSDDQYRELYISIWMVPQRNCHCDNVTYLTVAHTRASLKNHF